MAAVSEPISRIDKHPPPRRLTWETVLGATAAALLTLAVPLLILQTFDHALPSGQTWFVFAFALATVILGAGASAFRSLILDVSGISRICRIERRLSAPAGGLPDAMPLTANLITTAILLTALTIVAAPLAAPASVLMLIAFICGGVIGRASAKADAGPEDDGRALERSILKSLWTIKALGAERLVYRLMAGRRTVPLERLANDGSRAFSITLAETSLRHVTAVTVIAAGAVLTILDYLTIGQLSAGTWIAVMACPWAAHLGLSFATRRVSAGSESGQSRDTIRAQTRNDDALPALPPVTGNVFLNNIGISVAATDAVFRTGVFIDGLTLDIPQGEVLRITGDDRNKIGVLLQLIAGIERPDSGQILVDEHDLKEFRGASISRRIAYVPAKVDVFPGTIMENLTAFNRDRVVDAKGAARLVGLDHAVSAMPEGYDTRLAGVAQSYPAGFRQHLGIARALAVKPKVLVLDFATEDLDSRDFRTVTSILERLKGRVTIVFASTQMGLHLLADREIHIDELPTARVASDPQIELDEVAENEAPGASVDAADSAGDSCRNGAE
ncbi:MAG: ATP-binding cassette domain-containing protein [Rhodospirillaceae bacterium]